MSPMTIVCSPALVNAAHAVSPIGGVIRTPAAVASMSPRGSDTLKTPSFSSSALGAGQLLDPGRVDGAAGLLRRGGARRQQGRRQNVLVFIARMTDSSCRECS